MRTCVVCAVFAVLVHPAAALAQVVAVTESEILAQLRGGNPRVEALRAAVDVARADVLAAGRWPNPQLTFDRESVAGIVEGMFMVSQALPITGRRGLDVNAATARVEASASVPRTGSAVCGPSSGWRSPICGLLRNVRRS